MRLLIAAGVAALLLTPAVASACGASAKAQSVSSEYSAAKKKKPLKTAKKTRKPKEEYMRAAPM